MSDIDCPARAIDNDEVKRLCFQKKARKGLLKLHPDKNPACVEHANVKFNLCRETQEKFNNKENTINPSPRETTTTSQRETPNSEEHRGREFFFGMRNFFSTIRAQMEEKRRQKEREIQTQREHFYRKCEEEIAEQMRDYEKKFAERMKNPKNSYDDFKEKQGEANQKRKFLAGDPSFINGGTPIPEIKDYRTVDPNDIIEWRKKRKEERAKERNKGRSSNSFEIYDTRMSPYEKSKEIQMERSFQNSQRFYEKSFPRYKGESISDYHLRRKSTVVHQRRYTAEEKRREH